MILSLQHLIECSPSPGYLGFSIPVSFSVSLMAFASRGRQDGSPETRLSTPLLLASSLIHL